MPRNKRKPKSTTNVVRVTTTTMEDIGGGQIIGTTTKTTYSIKGVGIMTQNNKGRQMQKVSSESSTKLEKAQAPSALAAVISISSSAVSPKDIKDPPGTTMNGESSSADSSGIGGSERTTPACSPIPPSQSDGDGGDNDDKKGSNKGTVVVVKKKTKEPTPTPPPTTTTTTTVSVRNKVREVEVLPEKQRLRKRSLPISNTCSCHCCGNMFLDAGSDYEDDYDYYSGSECDFSNFSSDDDSELDEKILKGRSRMNSLLMQNAKTKLLMQKNKYYSKIISTQKIIRDQLIVLQRANALNSKFVRNMESIMRLGFCPGVLQQKTDDLSRGLLDVHKLIETWDDKLHQLIPVPIKMNGNDPKPALIPSLLQVFKDKYGTKIEIMTDAQFENALKTSVAAIPELLPDEETIKAALEAMDLMEVEIEWELFEAEIENHLSNLEVEFIDLCVEFGIRVRLPDVPGYEWAHAVGPKQPPKKKHGTLPSSKLKSGIIC